MLQKRFRVCERLKLTDWFSCSNLPFLKVPSSILIRGLEPIRKKEVNYLSLLDLIEPAFATDTLLKLCEELRQESVLQEQSVTAFVNLMKPSFMFIENIFGKFIRIQQMNQSWSTFSRCIWEQTHWIKRYTKCIYTIMWYVGERKSRSIICCIKNDWMFSVWNKSISRYATIS